MHIIIMGMKILSKHAARLLSLFHIIWKHGIRISLIVSKFVSEISFVRDFKKTKVSNLINSKFNSTFSFYLL